MYNYGPPPKLTSLPVGSNYYKLENDPLYEAYRIREAERKKLSEKDYWSIHTSRLRPLNLIIDCDLFKHEIKSVDSLFEQFGNTHTNLNRKSMPLTELKTPIESIPLPVNWPMDVWAIEHPNQPLFDADFNIPNKEFYSMESMRPMDILKDHLSRCCILKWGTGARFYPHLDTLVPSHVIRLWGTNDPDNNHFCFWNESTCQYEREENVEPGRLYLADTSQFHHAYSTAEDVYTFFFALQVSSYETIKQLL